MELETLERRAHFSIQFDGETLTVVGTGRGDHILVSALSDLAGNGMTVTLNKTARTWEGVNSLPSRVVVSGGAGNDEIVIDVNFEGVRVSVSGGSGSDRVELETAPFPATVRGQGGDDVLVSRQRSSAIAVGKGSLLIGGPGNDRLVGSPYADLMVGGAGDDTLFGGGDHDTLLGGAGDDRLIGGAGKDELDGGHGENVLTDGKAKPRGK